MPFKLIQLDLKSKLLKIAVGLLVLWIAYAYWFFCVHLSKDAISVGINKLLDSCTAEVVDAATDIDIQIKYLRQQPDLIAAAPIVLRALRNGPDVDPSSVNYESRKALLAGNAEYRQLSHYFKDLENSLGVDQIYLVDKWGTSVASSNWMSEGSSVGTNYKDRLNFIRGQSGFNTVQYSMGRTTHVPGLFFSTPLFQNKQFLGMLVVKLDLKNLLGFRGKTSTFLVDGNDVIVAAHDQRLNLTALSFDSIDLLTNSELNNLYLTDQLEKLNIDQWSKGEPLLTRFPGSSNPFVVASKSLNEYSLKVYEAKEFDAYYEISDKYQLFFIGASVVGSLIIILVLLLVSYVSNIKNSKDFLWYRLNHDALTGLPNQSYLLDKVGDLKEVSSNNCYSLVYIDIDRFKEINDHLGHQIGDQVIKEVAIRIQNVLPSNAWLCHLGGDKFAILLQNPKDVNYARDLCTKIKSALNPVFSFNTSSISIKTSIAYLLFSSNRDFLNNVLLQAELLIREARISGDSDVLEWTKEFAAIQRKKADIKNSLADAFVLGQFVPYFQPIVNLQNRKIEKAEFLIRWQHPEFGLLNPNEFISIAEQSGYILKIGAWCRQQSIRYCKKWVELFKYPFQISINKSPVELIDADVESSIHHFVNQIEEAGLSGSNFAFELTESILVEDAFTVTRKINQIVEAGIKLSIDDFGTGFSSLSYLDRFPFDFIKLDISFIEDLQTGSNKEVLCKHIIAMAHQLGIAVVAEGVETSDQESVLIDLGCDYAQGFLYSPPLNAKDFGLLLERNFNVS